MPQIIDEYRPKSTQERFGQAFANAGQSLGKAIPEYMEKMEKEKQNEKESQQYRHLTGRLLSSDPETRKMEIEYALKGELEENKRGDELSGKSAEKKRALMSGIETVNRMKNIRKGGRLGMLSGINGMFSAQTRKDRGEYSQLGKSLISLSTDIPIRNRLEFDTLAEKLYDPSLTDAEAEGVLKAMEQILNQSLGLDNQQQRQEVSLGPDSPNMVGKKPPLTSFMEK